MLPGVVRSSAEPFADPSAIPTWYVCKMVRRHVTVCLTGDGGDELFAGYARYQTIQREWKRMWRAVGPRGRQPWGADRPGVPSGLKRRQS